MLIAAVGLDRLESGSGRVLAASKGRMTRSRRTTKSSHGSSPFGKWLVAARGSDLRHLRPVVVRQIVVPSMTRGFALLGATSSTWDCRLIRRPTKILAEILNRVSAGYKRKRLVV